MKRIFVAVLLVILAGLIGWGGRSIAQLVGQGKQPDKLANFAREDPDGRARWRLLRLRNDSGHFDPNDLVRALAQKKAMRFDARAFGAASPAVGTQALGSWEELGPGNIGGRTRAIVIDPQNPQVMFLGAVAGGVWKTVDGGASWFALNDMMANLVIGSLAMDPRDSRVVYAGTGESGAYSALGFPGAGIFKTTDGGTTWVQLAATANHDFRYVNRLAISPTHSSVVLAATVSGIARSDDAGDSWTPVSNGNEVLDLEFHPTDALRAVAAGIGKVWYTTDGGLTWLAGTGLGPELTNRVEVAYAKSTPNVVFAAMAASNGQVFRSDDGGATYQTVAEPRNMVSNFTNALWVDPTNPNNILVGGRFLRRSTNGGVTFALVPGSLHVDHHVILEHPQFASNRRIILGNDGGIYISDDAVTAPQELNNNLRITQFYSGVGNVSSNLIAGGTQDNGTLRWMGNAEDWVDLTGGDGGYVATDPRLEPDGSSIFYLNTQYWGGPFRVKLDPSGIRTDFVVLHEGPADESNFIPPMVLDPNDGSRLYKGGKSLWRIENPRTATPAPMVAIKPPITASPADAISAIAVAPNNSDVIWVGHNVGQLFSTQNGRATTPTWTSRTRLSTHMVTRIAIDPFNGNRIYVTFAGFGSGKIWRSDDGGSTWTNIGGGLPATPVYGFTVCPFKPSRTFAGTEIGIFASNDAGATWSPSNDGPSNAPVDDLFWMKGHLVVATHGRGMFRTLIDSPPAVSLTSPADGFVYQPGSALTLTATASDPNGTVAKVEFFAGATKLGEDTSSPYSMSWTNVPGGTHRLTARATDNDGNVSVSLPVTIRDLPPPWIGQDIGATGVAGSATRSSAGVFTVKGSGADIWGTADAFQYVHQRLSGDFQIVARVASLVNTDAFAKAGVMMRASLDPNATNAYMAITAASGATFQTRTTTGGGTVSSRTTGFAAPHWVRLVRKGNTFTGYRSSNGTTWTQQGGSVTITMPNEIYVGLAVTSHNNTATTTATLSNVTITAGSPPVLLVVGNTTLGTGDTAIKNRLQGLGYSLTIKSAASSQESDANGQALVFITSTVAKLDITSKFLFVPVPVVVCEAQIYEDMFMTSTGSTNFGSTGSQTAINVIDASHPLAAGLAAGAQIVTSSAQTFTWGVPLASAAKVARISGNSTRHTIFAYETGAPLLQDLTAPARRVGFFLHDATAANLTHSGGTLVDAAVKWALNAP